MDVYEKLNEILHCDMFHSSNHDALENVAPIRGNNEMKLAIENGLHVYKYNIVGNKSDTRFERNSNFDRCYVLVLPTSMGSIE